MIRLIVVLFMFGASLCAAATQEEPPVCDCASTCGCECDTYPFEPDPPCYDCCAASTLSWLGQAELTTILGLDAELARKVAEANREEKITSLREYQEDLGDADFRALESALEDVQEERLDKAVHMVSTRSGDLDVHAALPEGHRLANIEMGSPLKDVEAPLAILARSQRSSNGMSSVAKALNSGSRYREACTDLSRVVGRLPKTDPESAGGETAQRAMLPAAVISELNEVDAACRRSALSRKLDLDHIDLRGLLIRIRSLNR